MTEEEKAEVDRVFVMLQTFTKEQADYYNGLFLSLADRLGKREIVENFLMDVKQ